MKLYTQKPKKYKQLQPEEIGQIEAYYKMGMSISEIARMLNRSKSTISYENRRGKHRKKYITRIAQNRSEKRRREFHKHNKWSDYKLLKFIEYHLKIEKMSPEIISNILKERFGIKFLHTSIYNLIDKHRHEWNNFLICRGKRRKKHYNKAGVNAIPNRVDISQRPSEVNLRNEEGHYEADTVLSSKGGKACLAVFVERKTRMYFLQKIKDKSAGEMLSATMKVFRDSKEFGPLKVLSITYDNGTENANHELVNRMLNCKSFFCAPYHSWEKGQIENRNKILRQFFPKGTNFDLISDKEIHKIQTVINNRPMKVLNWLSPRELFDLIRSAY